MIFKDSYMDEDLVWLEPQSPEEIVNECIKTHPNLYVLFSGGKDSVSTAHYIATNFPDNFRGVVFTNTGISSNITRKFVLEYTREREWPLYMTWAHVPYYDIVMENGFPGPGSHRIIMGKLKFQSWYWFIRNKKHNSAFISGVRKKESWARNKKRFYTKQPIDVNGGIWFCKPFLYKNGTQLMEYFIKHGLKKSPAYEWFDKSGECWCGCFYNDWELKMIETHDPFLFDTIKWMEAQLQKHGTKEAKKFPKWGRSVGADVSKLQTTFDNFEVNEDYCGESCSIE